MARKPRGSRQKKRLLYPSWPIGSTRAVWHDAGTGLLVVERAAGELLHPGGMDAVVLPVAMNGRVRLTRIHHCRYLSRRPGAPPDRGQIRFISVFAEVVHSKLSCESSAGVIVIFFFGLACGAGSETAVSSLSNFARIVFARSMTLKGSLARRASRMPELRSSAPGITRRTNTISSFYSFTATENLLRRSRCLSSGVSYW